MIRFSANTPNRTCPIDRALVFSAPPQSKRSLPTKKNNNNKKANNTHRVAGADAVGLKTVCLASMLSICFYHYTVIETCQGSKNSYKL